MQARKGTSAERFWTGPNTRAGLSDRCRGPLPTLGHPTYLETLRSAYVRRTFRLRVPGTPDVHLDTALNKRTQRLFGVSGQHSGFLRFAFCARAVTT